MTIPYTYQLHFKPTGQHYVGCRYKQGCHPDELMTHGGYQTSSKAVKELIDEYGLASFEVVHVKRHTSKQEALKYEEEIIASLKLGQDEQFLNRSNGGLNFIAVKGTHYSPESEFKKGNVPWSKGKKFPQFSERQMGEKNHMFGKIGTLRGIKGADHPFYGHTHTKEMCQQISERMTGEKNHMFGKKQSDESNERRSITLKATLAKKRLARANLITSLAA